MLLLFFLHFLLFVFLGSVMAFDFARPFLFIENSINFYLSPNERTLIAVLRHHPPIPSFEQALDHGGIVARPDIIFYSSGAIV